MTTDVETKSLPTNAYTPLEATETYKPLVPPESKPAELTARSIGWGILLCIIFTVASAYSGLKVGQVMEAAIPISILTIGLARVYRRRSTVLENVIVTGIGGVSGSVVAGAIFTLPALYILQLHPHPVQTIFICVAGGCLGVLFLIPLRRYFVRDMHGKLPYPEATAITEVLVTGEKGGSQAKLLLQATAISGVYDFFVTTFQVWKEYVNFQFVPVVRTLGDKARMVFSFDAIAFILGLGYVMVNWEELTAGDFVTAIKESRGTCMLPFGVMEKHGPQLPLGTDLINVRRAAIDAARQEYAVVFPEYYFAQIFEAQHEPGTVAYSLPLQLQLLQETVSEMSRNGCKKIVIVNGHGGNEHLLPLFAQAQLASPRDYVVYVFGLTDLDAPGRPPLKSPGDMHAGETETSHMMYSRPELVHMDKAATESGADLNRLKLPDTLYTGIWWYAKFPEHYAGNPAAANKALGEFDMKTWSKKIATAIAAVKADETSLKLQNEYFEKTKHPLDTKQ